MYHKKLLAPGGSFYLLLIQENKPQEIVEIMESYNLKYQVIIFFYIIYLYL